MALDVKDSTLNIIIKAKDQASRVLKDFDKQAKKSIGSGTLAAGAVQAIGVASGALAIKMGVDAVQGAIRFETSMAEVRKTTGFTADETKKFGDELLEMSKSLPVATDELASISAVAGQLGIEGTQNITAFTEVIAKATVALPEFAGGAEEIALASAKAINVFKLEIDEVENLLSSFNELANNTAANASEISKFITNAGGAAAQMGITADQAAGLGATLVSLGEDGMDAGTRVRSASLFMMKHLDEAAKQAGVSTAEFKRHLDENAIGAIQDVIKGLEKIPSSTDRSVKSAEIFGQIGGKVMTKLTGNLELLNKNLDMSADAWEQNISLQEEFDIAAETTAKQMILFKNNVNAILIDLGSVIIPVINDGLKGMIELLNGVNSTSINDSIASIDEATKKLITLRDEREAAGKDVTNLNKQIAEGSELQRNLTEDVANLVDPLGGLKTKESASDQLGGKLGNPFKALGNLLGFADGGVVPGPKGDPMLAMVHGGERITPPDSQAGSTIVFDLRNATLTDKNIVEKISEASNRIFNIAKFSN